MQHLSKINFIQYVIWINRISDMDEEIFLGIEGEAACRNWALGLGRVHLLLVGSWRQWWPVCIPHPTAPTIPLIQFNWIPVPTGSSSSSSSSQLLCQRETSKTTLTNGQELCIYVYILYNIWVDAFDFSLANLCAVKMIVKTFTKGVVFLIYLASLSVSLPAFPLLQPCIISRVKRIIYIYIYVKKDEDKQIYI